MIELRDQLPKLSVASDSLFQNIWTSRDIAYTIVRFAQKFSRIGPVFALSATSGCIMEVMKTIIQSLEKEYMMVFLRNRGLSLFDPVDGTHIDGHELEEFRGLKWPEVQNGVVLHGQAFLLEPRQFDQNHHVRFWLYNPTTNSVEKMLPEKHCHIGVALAVLNGKLFVCGGSACAYVRGSRVQCYDPEPKVWSDKPSMKEVRHEAVAGSIAGRVLVCGGSDERDCPLMTAESFDPEGHEWTSLPSMSIGRVGATAAVLGDRFFVCGGANDLVGTLNSVECYDPRIQSWSLMPSLTRRRVAASAAIVAGKIYVCGGNAWRHDFLRADHFSFEWYNQLTGAWVKISELLDVNTVVSMKL